MKFQTYSKLEMTTVQSVLRISSLLASAVCITYAYFLFLHRPLGLLDFTHSRIIFSGYERDCSSMKTQAYVLLGPSGTNNVVLGSACQQHRRRFLQNFWHVGYTRKDCMRYRTRKLQT